MQMHRTSILRIALLAMIVFISGGVTGQETFVYTGPDADLARGIELFRDAKYLAAKRQAESVLDRTARGIENPPRQEAMLAGYLRAVSLYHLDRPEARRALEEFQATWPESALWHRAGFYLGLYLDDNGSNRRTAEALASVDASHLTSAERAERDYKLAYAHFRTRDFDAAYPLFRSVAASGMEGYGRDARYYAGYIDFTRERWVEAENAFEEVAETERYADVVPYYRAAILYGRGDMQGVVDYALPFAREPSIEYYDELRHVLGRAYFELGDHFNALLHLEHAIDAQRTVSDADLYQLAYARYRTGDLSGAAEDFERLSLGDDSLAQSAMFYLADCYLNTGRPRAAADAFYAASQGEHVDDIAREATFLHGQLLADLGEYDRAVDVLTAFLDRWPADRHRNTTVRLLGDILVRTRDYPRAIEVIRTYGDDSPQTRTVLQRAALHHAIELLNDDRLDEADDMARLAMDEGIDRTDRELARFLRADIALRQGRTSEALAGFDRYVRSGVDIPGDMVWAHPGMARYHMGYAALKTEDYVQAAGHFGRAIETVPDRTVMLEATLRRGDCRMMTGRYDGAAGDYRAVVADDHPDAPYALMQLATIHRLQDETDAQDRTLATLLRDHPTSAYADDAAFARADLRLNAGDLEEAADRFADFERDHPTSPLLPRAILKSGLIEANTGRTDAAIARYQRVVRDYPESGASREALIALREMYVSQGRAQDFIDFTESTAGISIAASTRDSLRFESVEELFIAGACSRTIEEAGAYLDDFGSDGHFVVAAHFYRAECLFEAERFQEAMPHYEPVIDAGPSAFFEKSLVRASYIASQVLDDPARALSLYETLLATASFESNRRIALVGRVRAAFRLGRSDDAISFATDVIEADLDDNLVAEARFYRAKSALALDRLNEAMADLDTIVAERPVSAMRAESDYLRALIMHRRKAFQQSLDHCFEIKNTYSSYEDWVVRTYILIAENYAALDNVFQARATLQSIVDNYRGDEALLDEARRRLDELTAEQEKSAPVDADRPPADSVIFQNQTPD